MGPEEQTDLHRRNIMSEEKKELTKNEEICEGTKALSQEELDKVNGGGMKNPALLTGIQAVTLMGATCQVKLAEK